MSRKYVENNQTCNCPLKDTRANRKAITMQSKKTQSGSDNSQTRTTHQQWQNLSLGSKVCQQRTALGSAEKICRQLRANGCTWGGEVQLPVVIQSTQKSEATAARRELISNKWKCRPRASSPGMMIDEAACYAHDEMMNSKCISRAAFSARRRFARPAGKFSSVGSRP